MNRRLELSGADLDSVDQCLRFGDIEITQLALRVGGTPFFAYERSSISQRVAYLRQILPSNLGIHYSVKANPMPAVVQHIAHLVDGLDVASAGELQCALDTVIPNDRIGFAGPGKTDDELQCAIAAEVVIHVESEAELRRVDQMGSRLGILPKICLRINPDFELRASGMKMSGGAQPFGIDVERVPTILREMNTMAVKFHGFHIFCGSQNLQADSIIAAQKKIFQIAEQLMELAPSEPQLLNIGGGFGIPYFPKEQPLDVQKVADYLHQVIPALSSKFPYMKTVMELGRYLVGEAGIYVTRIVDKKISRGKTFLVVDGGMHQHLAASGNFGQVIRRNFPVAIGNRMIARDTETVSVVGCLCTPLDLLADQVALPVAEIGDLFVVFQSGAYGLSASPLNFLSHRPAKEVLV